MSQEPSSLEHIERRLILSNDFVSVAIVDRLVPNATGLYCLRLRTGSTLPSPYAQELGCRLLRLLYIGKAAPASLRRRLLRQELRGKGHGTFFRSVGTMLGYHPPRGSLAVGRSTFKFGMSDAADIVEWMNINLEVSWFCHSEPEPVEKLLIEKYKPILNIQNNPDAYSRLESQRSLNIAIGQGQDS